MKIINTAIIGFGLSGKVFHAPIISSMESFNLSKIYTRNQESISYISNNYVNTKIVNDVDEIMNDLEIELVIISTPNEFHYEYAKIALESGKHVIVEKPFTIITKEADDLINLANKVEKVLTVFQNRRYDSDFKTVKKVIESGKLGNIVEYEAHFDRFRNYLKNSWKEENKPGSGILYDLGPHLIDQALMLFGLPNQIFGDIRIQRECANTTDNFELILYYDKLKVTLKAGMLVKANLPRYIILGDQGTFIKYGMDVQEMELSIGNKPLNDEWGIEPESIWGELNTDKLEKVISEKGDYRVFYQNIYNTIVYDEKLQVTPKQAEHTIKIIELAILSNKEKRVVEFK
ncbi:MAG: oxidoreductase domain protein [Haloplasmataceae bacterium]|jgi:predicted dehydrogenase|nr:oxidoreductase domain protein [Haloplasmataceae bacterium]